MYAISENGTLRLIGSLPFRLCLPDGTTRTSLHELTEEQLAELGIYPVTEIRPEIKEETQFYGEPVVTVENGKAVAVYPVVDKSEEQIRKELESAKTAKLAELAEARWQAETGGITINGILVMTDDRSKVLLAGAVDEARNDPKFTTIWKGVGGIWVTLDAKTIITIGEAVSKHTQACFAKEGDLAKKVRSCVTIEEVESISW